MSAQHAIHGHIRYGAMGSPPQFFWVCSCGRSWREEHRTSMSVHVWDHAVKSAEFPGEEGPTA